MTEVVITRAGYESVVIVSLEHCQSLRRLRTLLRNPENARRFLASVARVESGAGSSGDALNEARFGRKRLG
jgi:antitoxin YefM